MWCDRFTCLQRWHASHTNWCRGFVAMEYKRCGVVWDSLKSLRCLLLDYIQAPHVPERAVPSRVDPFGSESCGSPCGAGCMAPMAGLRLDHGYITIVVRASPAEFCHTLNAENRTSIHSCKCQRPGSRVHNDNHTRYDRSWGVNRK